MKASIKRLQIEIAKLEARVITIQTRCEHKNYTKKNTPSGDYGDGDLTFTTWFHCQDCDKRWHITSK